jgi:hypothetical protein
MILYTEGAVKKVADMTSTMMEAERQNFKTASMKK